MCLVNENRREAASLSPVSRKLIGSQKYRDLRNVIGLPNTSERRLRDHLLCKVAAYDAMRFTPSVSTPPGAMVLTRIFFCPSSLAKTRVIESTAPFVAE